MNLKEMGASVSRVNQAAESLAKTDDMLAVLGIIMLLGVIVSAYGSFWQGRLAAAQFKKECNANPVAQNQEDKNKSLRYTIIITTAVLLIIGLMVYIFRKQIKAKLTGGSAVVA